MRIPLKFLPLAIVLVSVVYAQAQRTKNSFGICTGLGGGAVIQKISEGGGSMTLKTGISLGLSYYRNISAKTSFETGLVWCSNKLIFDPPNNPNANAEKRTEYMKLLYIPIFIRVDVSKVFFLQGGLLADLDFTTSEYLDDLTGLGAGIGLGFYIPLSEKIKLQFNPFMNLHGLNPNTDRMLETGIRLGVRSY